MQQKKCHVCNEEKPIDMFYVNFRYLDGHINVCKECRSMENKLYHQIHKDRVNKYRKTEKAINTRNEYYSREDIKEKRRIYALKWYHENKVLKTKVIAANKTEKDVE